MGQFGPVWASLADFPEQDLATDACCKGAQRRETGERERVAQRRHDGDGGVDKSYPRRAEALVA